MNPDFWNERYAADDYAYGTEPNVFFAERLAGLPPGRLLLPAEGEGRNAVYAAQRGWEVVCFDTSSAGRDKALRLAARAGVTIDYRVGGLGDLDFKPASFDALGLIYAHFAPELRRDYHRRLADLLRPGGTLLLESFAKGHQAYNAANPTVGGPRSLPMLMEEAELRADFAEINPVELVTTEVELGEGAYHRGRGLVVRMVGRREE